MANDPPAGRRARNLFVLVTVVLAAPILPAVFYGEAFGGLAEAWQSDPPPRPVLAGAVAAILAADILLPVPSGPLITLAGAELGVVPATAVCWVGLMFGTAAAFAVAYRWGPRGVARIASEDDLAVFRDAGGRRWSWVLLLSRPLPVLAEAAVIAAGIVRVPWRCFLAPTAAGNLLVASAHAALGRYGAQQGLLIPAILLSAVFPLVIALIIKRRPRRMRTE